MEEWRDIEGFKGYQISNKGRVRSFKKFNAGRYSGYDVLVKEPHIMNTTSDDGNGYLKVMLRKNGKNYCRKIHRLVAEAFIPNDDPEDKDTVDHISNDKYDNRVENLQWISRRENLQKAYRDGLHDRRIRKRMVGLVVVNPFNNQEFIFDCYQDAADFLGVDRTVISHSLSHAVDAFLNDYIVYKLNGR